MAEAVVFPDVVATTIDFLAAEFTALGDTDIEFGARIPVPQPDQFLVVTLIDSQIREVAFQRSVVRVEAWVDEGSTSQESAHDLGQLARGLLGLMAGTSQARGTVYRISDETAPQGLNDDPDPESGRNRYTFHVAITMRGVALEGVS